MVYCFIGPQIPDKSVRLGGGGSAKDRAYVGDGADIIAVLVATEVSVSVSKGTDRAEDGNLDLRWKNVWIKVTATHDKLDHFRPYQWAEPALEDHALLPQK